MNEKLNNKNRYNVKGKLSWRCNTKTVFYTQVRCGRLQKAQALAEHCGQPWRAACLLGWIPHHDPNYKNPLSDTKLPIEGNPNRSLWKLCAWELSQDKRVGNNVSLLLVSIKR